MGYDKFSCNALWPMALLVHEKIFYNCFVILFFKLLLYFYICYFFFINKK